MGEATYYLMAQFKTDADAEAACEAFRALNAEGCRAHDYWQTHRGEPSREAFFKTFNEKFPLVAQYLGDHTFDHNNGLAGQLDFIDEGDENIHVESGAILSASAYVWHFADWSKMEEWLEAHGAIKVVSLSDEYESFFDLCRYRLLDPNYYA